MTIADDALVLYRSDRFRGWIMVLLGNAARDVYGEAASVASHTERLALARRVLLSPDQWVERFLNAIIGDPEVATLGGVPEADWANQHLLTLRAQILTLWTPVAVDEAATRYGGIA